MQPPQGGGGAPFYAPDEDPSSTQRPSGLKGGDSKGEEKREREKELDSDPRLAQRESNAEEESVLLDDSEMVVSPTKNVVSRVPGFISSHSEILPFAITKQSKLVLQKGDITKWSIDGKTDAIVNAANERMLGGGGVDGAIHRAAGPKLLEACIQVKLVRGQVRCPVGEARITDGFKLPARHVIHTVGPIYSSDTESSPKLKSAYVNSLLLADQHDILYVSFPAISCGVYGYPFDKASQVSLKAIKETILNENLRIKEVHFVLFEDFVWKAYVETAAKLFQTVDS